MTYNIKNPDPAHHWERRLPELLAIVRRNDPDVLCVQEAFAGQMQDLRDGLPGWDHIGQGREGGSEGEHSAILFRTDRLEVLEHAEFWLSDTPDVVASNTWGGVFMRMATWGRFRDRLSGVVRTILTTHLDHDPSSHGDDVRRRSAELIARRLSSTAPSEPTIVTGDFNEGAGLGGATPPFVAAGFVDTWTAVGATDPVSSFNDWRPPTDDGVRIDWILTRGIEHVDSVRIDHDEPSTWSASDHFPVIASVR